MGRDARLHGPHRCAQVRSFQLSRDGGEPLQILTLDLVLRRKLCHIGKRAKRSQVARGRIKNSVLNRVQILPRLVSQAHPHGVRPAVGDHRVV